MDSDDFDIDKKMRDIAVQFSSLRSNYNTFRKKMYLQRGKKTSLSIITKLRIIESDISSLDSYVEDVIVELDKQGYWSVSKKDIDRIKADDDAMVMFKQFLPQMICSNKDLYPKNSYCIIL